MNAVSDVGIGKGRRSLPPLREAEVVDALVASAFSVSRAQMHSAQRGPAATAFARQVGMYLLHTSLDMSLTAVGRFYGRDRTTVSYACRVVEERRDERSIDTQLDCLEYAIRVWRSTYSVRGRS